MREKLGYKMSLLGHDGLEMLEKIYKRSSRSWQEDRERETKVLYKNATTTKKNPESQGTKKKEKEKEKNTGHRS